MIRLRLGGHGKGEVLRSQDAGGDGPVADRRLLPDVDPLQLGGGFGAHSDCPNGRRFPS